MITGGLGFIGSNLARRLVDLGADVLLVDSLIPDYGGNLFNIDGHRRPRPREHRRRAPADDDELPRARPRGDLQPRRPGQPHRLHARPVHRPRDQLPQPAHACSRPAASNNPGAKVVFAGTRQVYGKPDYLPVDERHLVRPTDVNGINKVAGEYYHLVYNNVFGVRACSLRLTNVYGPRQLIRHNRQGFIGWFIRLALEDREIQIFGDGSQVRDFVYVDDAADAFLRAGAVDACNGEVFNVGGDRADQPPRPRDAADRGRRHGPRDATSSGRPRRRRIDIGCFYSDSQRFREPTGWTPRVALREGLARTLAFYRDAPRPLHTSTRRTASRAVMTTQRFRSCALAPGRRCGAPSMPPIRRVIDAAAGSCSAPRSRRSSASSPPRPARAHAVGVGTGTDAIALTLRGLGIGPGDEVITTPLSAAYSALAIMMAGATAGLRRHRPGAADDRPGRHRGRHHAADDAPSCPCTCTGRPADMDPILAIAARHDLARGRRLRAGAPDHLRGPAGRHDRRRGRVQLLSDQEPRRARRRRRHRHERRGAGRAARAPAQRRPDASAITTTSSA